MIEIKPSGRTQLVPVLGHPIAQVKSPESLTRIFADRGHDTICVPMHVMPDQLSQALKSMCATQNVHAVLVTVPHKRAAFEQCDYVTDRAALAEAVNFLRKTEAGWHGDNTDGIGFLESIMRKCRSVHGKSMLLIGCGGAGASIALEALQRGVSRVSIHEVDHLRRDRIIEKLSEIFPGKVFVGDDNPVGFDIVANASPMGMAESDATPVKTENLKSNQFVACVVTSPERPALIVEAERIGCHTSTGCEMFAAQSELLADMVIQDVNDLLDFNKANNAVSVSGN